MLKPADVIALEKTSASSHFIGMESDSTNAVSWRSRSSSFQSFGVQQETLHGRLTALTALYMQILLNRQLRIDYFLNLFWTCHLTFKQDDFGLCVAEGQDPLDTTSELDPDRECDPIVINPDTDYPEYTDDGQVIWQKFIPISPCKNNCRGGKKIA